MNVYILYHYAERELLICEVIKDTIIKRYSECNVIIGEFYNTLVDMWDAPPDIILSIPPRDEHNSNYLSICKKIFQCSIISLLTEGFFQYSQKELLELEVGKNMYSPKMVDCYLFWGGWTRTVFLEILEEQKKISENSRAKVVGYIPYDKNVFSNYLKENEAGLYEKDMVWLRDYNKVVLCLTGFNGAEYTIQDMIAVSMFKYAGIRGKEEEFAQEKEAFKKQRDRFITYREKYINAIIEAAEHNPDKAFIIKLHPTELANYNKGNRYQIYRVFENYKNIRILDYSLPMASILPSIDVLVHYGSTAGMEAYIWEKVVVHLYDSKDMEGDAYPGKCIYESTEELDFNGEKSLGDILQEGVAFQRNDSIEKILKEQFDWEYDNRENYHPAERIVDAMMEANEKKQLLLEEQLTDELHSVEAYQIRKTLLRKIKSKKRENDDDSVKWLKETYNFLSMNKSLLFPDLIRRFWFAVRRAGKPLKDFIINGKQR